MGTYLLIESRDPFESKDVEHYWSLAEDLARAGNRVTLFLVENGVLPTRRGACPQGLVQAARAGVEVLADEFSLRERGIGSDRLTEGVRAAPLELVVDHLAAGCKALWH